MCFCLEKNIISSKYQRIEKEFKRILIEINDNKILKIKLNKICKINKGKQLNKECMNENEDYYVLNGGRTPSGFTDSWNVPENTITISEGGNSCGYVSFNKEKFYCSGHCYYLTLKTKSVDLNYLYVYLKFIEKEIMRLRVGSGLPNIQKGDIESIKISLPSIEKQKKIGYFFNLLNTKIELKENEIIKFKNFKKSLLQKMFI